MTRNEFRWRMLKQSLLQKKAKALLILLAVTMGASVVSALLNVQTDLRARMNRELRDYGPNVVILPEGNREYIPQEFWRHLQASGISNKVIAYTPQLFVPVKISNVPAILVGVDLAAYRKLYPSQEWTRAAGASEGNLIFVGKRLARKLKIPADNKVSVNSTGREMQFHVGGFVESGESEDDQLFLDLAQAQQLSGGGPRFQSILFSALGNLQEVQALFASIAGKHQGVTFQVIRKIAATESLFLDKISRLVGLVILLIFVILFFCIHTTVSTILISRQSEIALLRVLGARRKQIASALTSELLLLGLLGGISGYAVGMVMAQVLGKVLFHAFITPSFLIFLITLFFSLFLMVVSSILPISRAVNRQAALVLKEA
jgi:putative ABC transport system permease protein